MWKNESPGDLVEGVRAWDTPKKGPLGGGGQNESVSIVTAKMRGVIAKSPLQYSTLIAGFLPYKFRMIALKAVFWGVRKWV